MKIDYTIPPGAFQPKLLWKSITLAVPGIILLLSVTIPPFHKSSIHICLWKNFLNIPCPGCGMTRAFLFAGHGQFSEAMRMNPGSIPAFSIVVFLLINAVLYILSGRKIQITLNSIEKIFVYIAAGCMMIMIWVYNLRYNPWI